MVKKLAALAGGIAMLLGVASPALGAKDMKVINRGFARQTTIANVSSNTGYNRHFGYGGWITTGYAYTDAGAFSDANEFRTVVNVPCKCFDDVTVKNRGAARQTTTANASSNTGYNTGWRVEDISTGDADAFSAADSWANIYTTVIE